MVHQRFTANMSESKAKVTKATKQQKGPKSVPKTTYQQMVIAALGKSTKRRGLSAQAIKKDVVATAGLTSGTIKSTFVNVAIRKLVAAGSVTQVSGTGASGSFKVAQKKAVKKTPTKKPAAKKLAAKKPAAKKAAAKKATPKKAAPKKPAAKKPAAKKTPKKAAKKAVKKPKSAKK